MDFGLPISVEGANLKTPTHPPAGGGGVEIDVSFIDFWQALELTDTGETLATDTGETLASAQSAPSGLSAAPSQNEPEQADEKTDVPTSKRGQLTGSRPMENEAVEPPVQQLSIPNLTPQAPTHELASGTPDNLRETDHIETEVWLQPVRHPDQDETLGHEALTYEDAREQVVLPDFQRDDAPEYASQVPHEQEVQGAGFEPLGASRVGTSESPDIWAASNLGLGAEMPRVENAGSSGDAEASSSQNPDMFTGTTFVQSLTSMEEVDVDGFSKNAEFTKQPETPRDTNHEYPRPREHQTSEDFAASAYETATKPLPRGDHIGEAIEHALPHTHYHRAEDVPLTTESMETQDKLPDRSGSTRVEPMAPTGELHSKTERFSGSRNSVTPESAGRTHSVPGAQPQLLNDASPPSVFLSVGGFGTMEHMPPGSGTPVAKDLIPLGMPRPVPDLAVTQSADQIGQGVGRGQAQLDRSSIENSVPSDLSGKSPSSASPLLFGAQVVEQKPSSQVVVPEAVIPTAKVDFASESRLPKPAFSATNETAKVPDIPAANPAPESLAGTRVEVLADARTDILPQAVSLQSVSSAYPSVLHTVGDALAGEPASVETVRNIVHQVSIHSAEATGQELEIHLDPAELGNLRVKVSPAENGALSLTVTAERFETYDLLRRYIELAERAFKDLGYTDVSFDLGMHNSGSERRSDQQETSVNDHTQSEFADPSPGTQPMLRPGSGLDIRL